MNYPRCFQSNCLCDSKECSICVYLDKCREFSEERSSETKLSGLCRCIYEALKHGPLSTADVDEIVLKAGRRTAYPYIRKLREMGLLNMVCVGRTRRYTLFKQRKNTMKIERIVCGSEYAGTNAGALTTFVELSAGQDSGTVMKIASEIVDNRPDVRNVHLRGDIQTGDAKEILQVIKSLLLTSIRLKQITIEVTNKFRVEELKRYIATISNELLRKGCVVSLVINIDLSVENPEDHIIIQDLDWIRDTDALRFICKENSNVARAISILKSIQQSHIKTTVLFASATGSNTWLMDSVLHQDLYWMESSFDVRVI